MRSYSQNAEDLFVLNYFKGFKGTLLEIGANDGRTLSNSLLLIENGWEAHLIEPGKVYSQLEALHKEDSKVRTYNFGLGDFDGDMMFWESGPHIPGGLDTGLVSTSNLADVNKWKAAGVKFEPSSIEIVSFKNWHKYIGYWPLEFISIDCEGSDWSILQQIDLEAVGCKCLIIEWNGDPELSTKFTNYCAGYKLAHINSENLVFCK